MDNTNDNTVPRKVFRGYYDEVNKPNPSLILPIEQINGILRYQKRAKAEHYVIYFLLLKYAAENKYPKDINELVEATGMKPKDIREAIAFWFGGYLLPKLPGDGYDKLRIKWVPSEEEYLCDWLARILEGKKEVSCPVGRVDVFTNDRIIEVKKLESWKSAIGQILSYAKYFPQHKKCIVLAGLSITIPRLRQEIVSICHPLSIEVILYKGDEDSFEVYRYFNDSSKFEDFVDFYAL